MNLSDPLSLRGQSAIIGVILLVGVTLIIGVVLAIGAFAALPQDQSVRPNADFVFDHTGESLVVRPMYMDEGTEFTLQLNEQDAYTWTGDGAREEQRLRCLNKGDSVRITNSPQPRQSYLIEEHTVETPTGCGLSGSASRFASATVDGRKMALRSQKYDFTLSIDPDGPSSVNGNTRYSTTNSWNYIERYDRTVEGLGPPVYVVVFADNVGDWSSEPTESDLQGMADSFTVDGSGNVSPTPGGSEPTNDVYMVFKPGCTQSQFVYIDKSAAYDNHIYLDDNLLFIDSNTSPGQTFTGPGVDCV